MVEKKWDTSIHEDGSRVIDLKFFFSELGEMHPIAAVYGLTPEEVAIGVLAQKNERVIRMSEYINTLTEQINLSALEEGATYN
jgi:hypothetical protein